ncbi:MAG: 2'-5' RNA ligase family protein [Microbacterium enclense]
MTTLVSLELTFDEASDGAVRQEWEALRLAGLPSQADHTGASNRPHVTLLVRSSLERFDGASVEGYLPMPLTLGAPILFGTRRTRVLARSIVPSAALLHFHAAVHQQAGSRDEGDHTAPGAWTPHVTLARRIPIDRLGAALEAVAAVGGGELEVRAVQLRRWDAADRRVTRVAGRGTLDQC